MNFTTQGFAGRFAIAATSTVLVIASARSVQAEEASPSQKHKTD